MFTITCIAAVDAGKTGANVSRTAAPVLTH